MHNDIKKVCNFSCGVVFNAKFWQIQYPKEEKGVNVWICMETYPPPLHTHRKGIAIVVTQCYNKETHANSI